MNPFKMCLNFVRDAIIDKLLEENAKYKGHLSDKDEIIKHLRVGKNKKIEVLKKEIQKLEKSSKEKMDVIRKYMDENFELKRQLKLKETFLPVPFTPIVDPYPQTQPIKFGDPWVPEGVYAYASSFSSSNGETTVGKEIKITYDTMKETTEKYLSKEEATDLVKNLPYNITSYCAPMKGEDK